MKAIEHMISRELSHTVEEVQRVMISMREALADLWYMLAL